MNVFLHKNECTRMTFFRVNTHFLSLKRVFTIRFKQFFTIDPVNGYHFGPYHHAMIRFASKVSTASHLSVMLASGVAQFQAEPDPRCEIGSTYVFDYSHFLKYEDNSRVPSSFNQEKKFRRRYMKRKKVSSTQRATSFKNCI